jgi:hypothetical protein
MEKTSMTHQLKSMLAAAAIVSTAFVAGASAMPAAKTATAPTSPAATLQKAAWTCGPYHCWWHPNYYGGWGWNAYRPWWGW